MSILVLTDATFENEVIQSKLPVIVEFGAEWCGPCKRQLPILEFFAKNNENLVKVCKVDIDDCSELAKKMGIRAVPTIILFKDGKVLKTVTGLQSGAQLENMLPENQIDPIC